VVSIKKIIYIILGFITLFLGIIGIIIPLLPTTPFLLLTGFFFLKGSDKLYNWLINHKIFGPYLYNYITYRSVSKRSKIIAISLIWITIPISIIKFNKLIVTIILLTILFFVTIYILSLKTIQNDN